MQPSEKLTNDQIYTMSEQVRDSHMYGQDIPPHVLALSSDQINQLFYAMQSNGNDEAAWTLHTVYNKGNAV